MRIKLLGRIWNLRFAPNLAHRGDCDPPDRPNKEIRVLSTLGGEDSATPQVDIRTLTAEDVMGALERAGGVHEKAWRELGLGNRHVLRRLMKKHNIA